jgi:hypothetical protein
MYVGCIVFITCMYVCYTEDRVHTPLQVFKKEKGLDRQLGRRGW